MGFYWRCGVKRGFGGGGEGEERGRKCGGDGDREPNNQKRKQEAGGRMGLGRLARSVGRSVSETSTDVDTEHSALLFTAQRQI